jgi:nucleotide-binding universal stress UspA family protein
MNMVKRILFPVDLAGSSHRIVRQVRSLADQFDAELHLLFVVGTLGQYSTFYVPHPSLDLMELEAIKHAERELDEFAEKYFEDRPRVKRVVLSGDPLEQIRKYLDSAAIDMVIVTSHERHGIQRAIFGNTAEEIVGISPVPVTIINPYDVEKPKVQPRHGEISATA